MFVRMILIVTLLAACESKPVDAPAPTEAAPAASADAAKPEPFSSVSGAQARTIVASGGKLVDVRTPEEFASGHIDGAINIPVQDLAARKGELDATQPTVVYCASGRRSAAAMDMLKGSGFAAVYNAGGISNLR
ncbi:MAG: rhodanese-like domain-containing protein [bacterium]